MDADRAVDRALLGDFERAAVVLLSGVAAAGAVRRLLEVLLDLAVGDDLEDRAVLVVSTALVVAAGFDAPALEVFRRARRWILRRASINSSFRIACHPVTSC